MSNELKKTSYQVLAGIGRALSGQEERESNSSAPSVLWGMNGHRPARSSFCSHVLCSLFSHPPKEVSHAPSHHCQKKWPQAGMAGWSRWLHAGSPEAQRSGAADNNLALREHPWGCPGAAGLGRWLAVPSRRPWQLSVSDCWVFPVLLFPDTLLVLASCRSPGGDEVGDGTASRVTAKPVA